MENKHTPASELLEVLQRVVKLNSFREFNDHIPLMKSAIANALNSPTPPAQPSAGEEIYALLKPFAQAAECFAWPVYEDGHTGIALGTHLTVKHLRDVRDYLARTAAPVQEPQLTPGSSLDEHPIVNREGHGSIPCQGSTPAPDVRERLAEISAKANGPLPMSPQAQADWIVDARLLFSAILAAFDLVRKGG